MAGTITHAYFAMDVFNKLDNNIKKNLSNYQNNLRTFAQGHDIFDFTSGDGHLFHTKSTDKFFINLIKYTKEKELYNEGEILSFIYGYICHYVLDKNIHPYVIYISGVYDKDRKKETKKYRCKHAEMETFLDCYMVKIKEKENEKEFKSHKFCLEPNKFSKELNDTIDYTFNKTYKLKNASKKYYRGIKNMHFLYILLRNDKHKIKYTMYKIADKITPIGFYKFAPISFTYNDNLREYLNEYNEEWINPIDLNEKNHTSFLEIYNNSIKEATKIIKQVNDYFNNKDIDLTKVFDNSSFVTGRNCNIKTKPKYFKK